MEVLIGELNKALSNIPIRTNEVVMRCDGMPFDPPEFLLNFIKGALAQ